MDLFGNFTFGDFTIIDLIAAGTNALNGALLARHPSHNRNYTIVGVILLAVATGIGGIVARDVLLNKIPAPIVNPAYLFLCIAMGIIGLIFHYQAGQKLRDGALVFMAAFSLPWYAVVGAAASLDANLPDIAAVFIGVIGATAGRYIIDVTSGVTPQHFIKGEWFVGTTVLSAITYVICAETLGLTIWPASVAAFIVGFIVRLAAIRFQRRRRKIDLG